MSASQYVVYFFSVLGAKHKSTSVVDGIHKYWSEMKVNKSYYTSTGMVVENNHNDLSIIHKMCL